MLNGNYIQLATFSHRLKILIANCPRHSLISTYEYGNALTTILRMVQEESLSEDIKDIQFDGLSKSSFLLSFLFVLMVVLRRQFISEILSKNKNPYYPSILYG